MFGDYKESIKILERQRSLHAMRLKRTSWWDVAGKRHYESCINALNMAIAALQSAWNAEEEEFSRKYLQSGAIDMEELPYDAVALYKRELAAKKGECDA